MAQFLVYFWRRAAQLRTSESGSIYGGHQQPLDSWYEWLHFVVNHSEGGGLIGNYELQRALVELCIETNDFPDADIGFNYFLRREDD